MNLNKKLISKIAKWITLGMLTLLGLMAVLPFFIKDKITSKIESYINSQLTSDMTFGDINLTFFRHFPNLTVSLDDVYLQSAEGFQLDTLLYTEDLSFGINIASAFRDKIEISGIYLNKAKINILRDTQGNANFDIFKPSSDTVAVETDSSSVALQINNLKFSNSDFSYQDTDLDFSCLAKNFQYTGNGNLQDGIVNLASNLEIQFFELTYEGTNYLSRKRVIANLQTKIDTESTALTFERNHLMINELPVDFVGKLEFITGGYDMNFILESVDTDFKNILSIIPEELGPWLDDTNVKGKGEIRASLQGQYLPEQNLMPNFLMNLFLFNGYISHIGSSVPVENLYLDLDVTVPGFNISKTILALDSISMKLGDGFFQGHFNLDGMEPANLDSDVRMNLDLELLDRALGLTEYDMKGDLELSLMANGKYEERLKPVSYRTQKSEISSIPIFSIKSSLSDGYFKWASLPEAIQNISWDLEIKTPDSLYQNIGIDLKNFGFKVLENSAEGFFKIKDLKTMDVDAVFKTNFNLADIQNFYPLDSGMSLKGFLDIDLTAKGSYDADKKLFPIIRSKIALNEGFIKTPYSELGLEDISFVLNILSEKGSFEDLKLDIQPIAFTFAGHPFSINANLANLNDVKYAVKSEGRIDLGKLYQTFGIEGYDVDGYIQTDLRLDGLKSDAISGNLGNLNNNGTLEMEKIKLQIENFPFPLIIHSGKIRFEKEKLFLEKMSASYAQNSLSADGYLFNIIEYYLDENAPVKGSIILSSKSINVSDFMFYSEAESVVIDTLGTVQGVVLIPNNIDFTMTASVESILFEGMKLENFKGKLGLKDGVLKMENTGFKLAGGDINMSGKYVANDPFQANFDYSIRTIGFDIQRAYNEIPLFKEMVSSAEYAKGIASLDYTISGKLDANMDPILPSIKGEGILALDKIKMKGFKLMNTIAKDTENVDLSDPELEGVQIRSSIANNLITIERTRMRIAGFRPRFEGQVSLDGDMSIAFRLGLPPLGLFGIPIKITGNSENPIIEVGRMTDGDELEEVEEKVETEVEGGGK